ncbi:hypothetical protein OH77DRAFT_1433205 [Trametes cingulata]|nr:hypothetical protein OH77DRAFT_1433205 [Trametes cingulata]
MSGNRSLWTSAQEAALVDTLCKEKDRGRQAESGWKRETWTAALEAVNAAEGPRKSLEQVKHRWQKMKRQYQIVKALINALGFGWDDEEYTVIAEPEVWAAYLQV